MNCLLDVSLDLFVTDISSHCPSVDHLWELQTSGLVGTESFSQNIYDFSVWFDISWIVACWEHKGWGLDLSSQLDWVSTENLLDSKWWMHSSNGNNVIKLTCHFESEPNTPTESNNEKPLVSFLFQIFNQSFKSGSHHTKILSLDAGDNFSHVHLSIIWLNQEFW